MKIAISRSNNELTIALRGDINESCEAELEELAGKIEADVLHFELEKIELINSLGARHWIQFMQKIAKKGNALTLRNCSPAFIDSCNIFPNFAPRSAIVSLFIPVACEHCGTHENRLAKREQFMDDTAFNTMMCNKCGDAAAPEVELEEYLQCVRGSDS